MSYKAVYVLEFFRGSAILILSILIRLAIFRRKALLWNGFGGGVFTLGISG